MDIKKVVVIGSGTMGSGIAAHLCNANIPVTLLDLTTEISEKARDRIFKSKPPLLLDKSNFKNFNKKNNYIQKLPLEYIKWNNQEVIKTEKITKLNLNDWLI